MAEVEVSASGSALAMLEGLGATVRPAERAGYVLAGIPAEQEEALQRAGIAYTVARRFVQIQGSGNDLRALSYGPSAGGSNLTNVTIPDNNVSVNSAIDVSGIPAGNVIVGVDLHVIIQHPSVVDLIVEIHDPGESVFTLSNRDPVPTPYFDKWKSYMPHWNGRPGNGVWRMWVVDKEANGASGYIDLWSLQIYYAPLTPPPTCAVPSTCLPPTRINAGGPAFVDGSGKTWQADRGYASCTAPYWGNSGGASYTNPQPIDGTS